MPIAIGVTFVLAGFLKAWDAAGLNRVLLTDRIRVSLVTPLARLVVQGEVILGFALALGVGGRITIGVAICVLLAFTAQLVFLLASASAPECECLRPSRGFETVQTERRARLVRNSIMLVALMLQVLRHRPRAEVQG